MSTDQTHDKRIQQAIAPQFRTDINGLRAIAVIAVVLYHFGVPGATGGFAGVDIFFVISGYLMTSILIQGLSRGPTQTFSIATFYAARARRIVPALLVLNTALMAAGWFLLLPKEYAALGTHVAASSAFVSNIKFWMEAGYFDASSHEKWLLHTWSLSVEWQFYLVYPWLVKWLYRANPSGKALKHGLWLLTVGSLATCIAISRAHPTAAFFSLPTRAWEMLCGGLVYIALQHTGVSSSTYKKWLECVGMVMVLGPVAVLDGSTIWPGIVTMIPVIGAVAILLADRREHGILNTATLQWLGDRSYSIYLWHWPIVISMSYFEYDGNPLGTACSIGLSIIIGNLSYLFVERPTRRKAVKAKISKVELLTWGSVATLSASGIATTLLSGIPLRLDPQVVALANGSNDMQANRDKCHIATGIKSPECHIGGDRVAAIVIGDSHANAVASAIAAALPDSRDAVVELTYSGCPLLENFERIRAEKLKDHNCTGFVKWAKGRLKQFPSEIPVFIVTRPTIYSHGWNELHNNTYGVPIVEPTSTAKDDSSEEYTFQQRYSKQYTRDICEIGSGRPAYLLQPIPEMQKNIPSTLAHRLIRANHEEIVLRVSEYRNRHADTLLLQERTAQTCSITLLDPLPYLCPDGICHSFGNGRPYYFDDDHLSEFGNKLLLPLFSRAFADSTSRIPRNILSNH